MESKLIMEISYHLILILKIAGLFVLKNNSFQIILCFHFHFLSPERTGESLISWLFILFQRKFIIYEIIVEFSPPQKLISFLLRQD